MLVDPAARLGDDGVYATAPMRDHRCRRASNPLDLTDVVGVGVDLVGITAFAEQLDEPGTRFAQAFTPGERRAARAG